MLQPSIFKSCAIAAALAFTGALAAAADASTFSVDPTIVTLPKGNSSASIAVTNQSHEPLRLQLSGFSWHQKSSGEMQLDPSQNLVFFPQLLTIGPGETRRVRVGLTSPRTATEQSYRVFLEELPSLSSVINPKAASISIRMKVGVPVFLSPLAQASSKGDVRNVAVRGGMLSFDVVNTGNVHFVVRQARVVAKDARGATLLDKNLSGWYVLPGETRHFALPIAKSTCEALGSLGVQVDADPLKFGNTFAEPRKQCGSGTSS